MRFAKYEGAGNDFILLDLRNGGATPQSAEIARLCDRHFGIGADGLMTLAASAVSGCDCSMRYYNADGSPGEMCGNGGRCFALFAHHLGIGGDIKRFDSTDGIHEARMLRIDGLRSTVELGMIDVERIDRGDGYWFLDTGVPHYVEFTDDLEAVDVIGRGRRIRYDKRFAKGTNVNFVKVVGPGHIAVRTYERGVEDETLACGTDRPLRRWSPTSRPSLPSQRSASTYAADGSASPSMSRNPASTPASAFRERPAKYSKAATIPPTFNPKSIFSSPIHENEQGIPRRKPCGRTS